MTSVPLRRYPRSVGLSAVGLSELMERRRLLATHGTARIFQLEPDVYHLEFDDHLTVGDLKASYESVWSASSFRQPYGLILQPSSGDVTYDPELRNYPGDDPLHIPGKVGVVVTDRAVSKMVVSAIGLALRLKGGIVLVARPDLEGAYTTVREVLDKEPAGAGESA